MKGDLIGALTLVKKATSAANDHPVYQFRLAVLLEKTDELEGALGTMRDAIRLDASRVHFHEGLVRVLGKLGYLTEKLTALDIAIEQHPQHAQFYYQRGACLEQDQDLEGALLAMQQAVNLEGAVTRFQIGLARVFVKLKKLDAAISVIRSALLLLPNDAQLHHQLGLILERSGNLDGAKAAIVLATKLSPKNERFKASLVRLSKQ
jgi:Flp pilus assembly protein TadD